MHILLVLITAWICLNKPEKDLVVMRIPNSPEFQTAHHLQYIPARSFQPSHKANYRHLIKQYMLY